jgi:predicted transcriptional regulator
VVDRSAVVVDSRPVIILTMNAARLLRYARRGAGLTQRGLAARAGVPQPAIARIEAGAVSPRMDTLAHLISATGNTLELAPRLGEGVDRTMFAGTLALTPEERIEAAGRAGISLAAFRDEVRNGRTRT